VVAFAKKTGDYAVLSQTDLSVIALTCQYELEVNGDQNVRSVPGERKGPAPAKNASKPMDKGKGKQKEQEQEQAQDQAPVTEAAGVEQATGDDNAELEEGEDEEEGEEGEGEEEEDVSQELQPVDEATTALADATIDDSPPNPSPAQTVSDKHDQEDSDGGEWINPSNVSKHRSRDLGLVPAGAGSDQSPLAAACMTGDYAVQNVLLSMGLGLIGEQGKRINKVKSWVLRCHACFK
jgi:RNA-binding protein NOB1